VAFCIAADQMELAQEILEELRQERSAGKIIQRPDVALISVFGPDFRERPGIAGTMFSALCERRIDILAISTSISTLSCVIYADRLDDAIAAMHETFDLPTAGRKR
jgi:aspartate kinase